MPGSPRSSSIVTPTTCAAASTGNGEPVITTSKVGTSGFSMSGFAMAFERSGKFRNAQRLADSRPSWIVQVVGLGDGAPLCRVAIDLGGNTRQGVSSPDAARGQLGICFLLVFHRVQELEHRDRQGR